MKILTMRLFRRYVLAVTLLVVFSLFSMYYLIKQNKIADRFLDGVSVNDSYKTILYWNDFFGTKDFSLGFEYVALNCPVYKNCFATNNRLVKKVDEFDIIIIHGIYSQSFFYDYPIERKPEQLYAFMTQESPITFSAEKVPYDGYYNVTMTYHLESDVSWPYDIIVERDNEDFVVAPSKNHIEWKIEQPARDYDQEMEENQLNSIIKNKKKMAIWYRAHCYTYSRREIYIAELEKHMDVTSHGKCSWTVGCTRDRNCFKEVVEPDYFFYLSFENSLCDDYVTEKFFYPLRYNVVPVVYGGANYSRFAPPKSYINALDFDSPKELADHLIKLSKNPIEYKKYFDWKRRYRVISPKHQIVCNLCEMLHKKRESKTYDVSKWYSNDQCAVQNRLNKQISQSKLEYATRQTLLN